MNTLTKIEAHERSNTIDLATMDVELDLLEAENKDNKTFDSYSSLTFTPKVEETFFDIIAESIESVAINGQIADFEYDGSKLFISGLTPNKTNTVKVSAKCYYSITGEGLHRYFDPEDGRCYLYTHYEPTAARKVYACFDQPDLKANWNFTVIAPQSWIVLSNSPEDSSEATGNASKHVFKPTPKLSSYITAIVAGEYFKVTEEYVDPNSGQKIDLGVYCRQSLSKYFDYEDFLYVTKCGLEFYNKNYDYPYPWGKYDQILVPEYNIGAMENPGCITYSEKKFLFKNTPTIADRQSRANTILHEMCHMWFGDLVTPLWWDDLWLKESFADHQGTFTTAFATKYKQAWSAFACRRKAWAYQQDSLPTTHPILADIKDVDAASENFDGITYAKGASVLKQLVAWVGEENFFKAAADYFKHNAYKATTLVDLTKSLNKVIDKDFDDWIEKWLNTTNASVITARIASEGDEIISLSLKQECITVSGEKVIRPHQLKLGLYRFISEENSSNPKLVRYECLDVELADETVDIDSAVGLAKPDVLVINDEDLTYAITRVDDTSVSNLVKGMHTIESSLTRAVLWLSLFTQARDGILPINTYLEIVLNNLHREENDAIVQCVLDQTQTLVSCMKPENSRTALASLARFTHSIILDAPSYDLKLAWAKAYLNFASRLDSADFAEDTHAEKLLELVNNNVDNFETDLQLMWQVARVLAIYNVYDLSDLDALKEKDPSGEGIIGYMRAKASILGDGKKQALFEEICTNKTLSNEQLLALLDGFNTHLSDEEKLVYADKYFERIEQLWNERSIVMARHITHGLFPKTFYVADVLPDYNPVLEKTRNWLTTNLSAPHVLRKLIVENYDLALKSLRTQSVN
ncbi:aminopeptidase N [Actinomyces sp. zg-332]|uniref:aminopeptidase N n=1 Tax=Actinomyces sp. zg-332 TaxID=2708340 RepID=UPI00142180C4|nr:aminopeptidase N [Actinomyces sp. zg-332]QPK94698.1 aminopeptidase N [Actinomyces sp. zg-332]